MRDNIINGVKKYKIALAVALGISAIGYFNPTDYKSEYDIKAEAIEKKNNEIIEIEKNLEIDEMKKEAKEIEVKNNELKETLEKKELEVKKAKEAKTKAEEEAKKKAEQKKEEENKNNSNGNNKGNSNGSGSNGTTNPGVKPQQPQKPQTPKPQVPAAGGSMVYANGGSSTSNKYHSSPTAHKMEGAVKMSESDAKAKGYVACKKCY